MRTLITGIGQVVSGDSPSRCSTPTRSSSPTGGSRPSGAASTPTPTSVIDAHGTTVIPGLIDSHAHPVFGDYTPRQRTSDFIESSLHGGVTTMISAGEVHTARAGRRTSSASRPSPSRSTTATPTSARPGSRSAPAPRSWSSGWSSRTSPRWRPPASGSIGEIGLGLGQDRRRRRPDGRLGSGARDDLDVSTPAARRCRARAPSAPTRSSRRTRTSPATSTAGRRRCPERDIARLVEAESGIALEIVHCGNGRTALVALGGRGRGRRARPGHPRQRRAVRDRGGRRSGSCG